MPAAIVGQVDFMKVKKEEDARKFKKNRSRNRNKLSKIMIVIQRQNKRNLLAITIICCSWPCLMLAFLHQNLYPQWKILQKYSIPERQQQRQQQQNQQQRFLIANNNRISPTEYDKQFIRFKYLTKEYGRYFGVAEPTLHRALGDETFRQNIKTLLREPETREKNRTMKSSESSYSKADLDNRVIDMYFDQATFLAIEKLFERKRRKQAAKVVAGDATSPNETTNGGAFVTPPKMDGLATERTFGRRLRKIVPKGEIAAKPVKIFSGVNDNESGGDGTIRNEAETLFERKQSGNADDLEKDTQKANVTELKRIFENLIGETVTEYEQKYSLSNREDNANLWKYFYAFAGKISLENVRNNFDVLPYVIENGNANGYANKRARRSADGKYLQYDSLANGLKFEEYSNVCKVTLATQSSLDRLHSFVASAVHWNGPISVAVFLNGPMEYFLFRGYLSYLKRCRRKEFDETRFSVATPSVNPIPKLTLIQTTVFDSVDCAASESSINDVIGERIEESKSWMKNHWYPQNMMRNQAKRNSRTPYHLILDVDIIPSRGMSEALTKFVSSSTKMYKNALVIPTYEVSAKSTFPQNKAELVALARKQLAQPFHKVIFSRNQNATDFPKWEKIHDSFEDVRIVHTVIPFQMYYEPFFVESFTSPFYDENFTGYGFTRSSHAYEMNVRTGNFQVLSPVFTVQLGIQKVKRWSDERLQQNEYNRLQFEKFVKNLSDREHLMEKVEELFEGKKSD